ncbi:MAG: 5'/3'-nucleotidase SurE [Chloroflexota bacterium]|nr:5'/3'-nucleotidase SurE [Chloroflexota bacterium]
MTLIEWPACQNYTTRDDILKILLTNDDGIHAPGLWAAAEALSGLGDLYIVAPDREQSGVGASLTLHHPLLVHTISVDRYVKDRTIVNNMTAFSVEGTPADSAILALEELVGPVDLVVSGINSGSNLGWDVIVSGTVGAAFQGYMRGYPTIAISVGSIQNPIFTVPARLLKIISEYIKHNTIEQCFLNVNVPSVKTNDLKGVEITRLGGRSYGESVRKDTSGIHEKYWISRNRPIHNDNGNGTDMFAMKNNIASITPIALNFTNSSEISSLELLLSELSDHLFGIAN